MKRQIIVIIPIFVLVFVVSIMVGNKIATVNIFTGRVMMKIMSN